MAGTKQKKRRAPLRLVKSENTTLPPLDTSIFHAMAPAQRQAWDAMWDMLIAKAMPHVLTYIQECDRQRQAA